MLGDDAANWMPLLARRLRRVRRRFLGATRPALTSVERFVLDSVLAELPEPDRSVLVAQLGQLDLVQRSPGGRLAALYLDFPPAPPLLSNIAPEHCLAKVKLSGQGRTLNATVITHRGLVSSVEFRGAADRVGSKGLSLLSVTLHEKESGVSGAIDRLEHGRQHA